MRLYLRLRPHWRLVLPLLCWLLLVLPLVVLAARWVANQLSTPVWFVVWYANLVLESVPQDLYWTLLVAVSAVLAILSLVRRRRATSADSGRVRPSPRPVSELAGLLGESERGYYFQWSLAQELSRLVVDTVEGRRLGPADLRREWYAQDKAGVPRAIQAYVREAIWGSSAQPRGGGSLWRRIVQRKRASSALEIDPELVVEFIEERLEVPNEGRHS